MARFFATGLAVFIVLAALPALAQTLGIKGPSTNDPADPGFAFDQNNDMYPVEWENAKAACRSCDALALSYNKTMATLMYTRFWIADIQDEVDTHDKDDEWQRKRRLQSSEGVAAETEIDPEQDSKATAELDYSLALEDLAGRLPVLKDQQASLEALAADLVSHLNDCGMNICKNIYGPFPAVDEKKSAGALPFDWKGPYPQSCPQCVKHATLLNALPDEARNAQAGLEEARAAVMFAEMEVLAINMDHNAIMMDSGTDDQRTPEQRAEEQRQYDKKTQKRIGEMEREKAKAEKDVAQYEYELDTLKGKFDTTEQLFGQCTPACDPAGPDLPPQSLPQTRADASVPAMRPAALPLPSAARADQPFRP